MVLGDAVLWRWLAHLALRRLGKLLGLATPSRWRVVYGRDPVSAHLLVRHPSIPIVVLAGDRVGPVGRASRGVVARCSGSVPALSP